MPLSLAQILALLPDNTTGAISEGDLRDIATALYGWIPYGQKYQMGRLPGETAHGNDDFFTTYTGYTELAVTGTATWAASNNGLSAVFASQGSQDFAVAIKPMSTLTPPVTIETMLSGAVNLAGNPGFGLLFTDGVISTSNAVGLGILANWGQFAPRGTLTAMSSTVTTSPEYRYSMMGPMLHRLVWVSANTWAWAMSPDYGSTWTDFTSTTFTHTLTPTHIGFWVSSWSQIVRQVATFPYLRVYDADLSI